MTGQLQLVDVPPTASLTPRQTRALELVTETGSTGIHADELGAILHEEHRKHTRHERCVYDGANGNSILKALRKKGLVRYRRGTTTFPGSWVATGAPTPRPSGMLADDEELPF